MICDRDAVSIFLGVRNVAHTSRARNQLDAQGSDFAANRAMGGLLSEGIQGRAKARVEFLELAVSQ